MPVSATTLSPLILSAMASRGLVGPNASSLAQAVAMGVSQFIVTIPVTTLHVGVLGAGQGQGKVTLGPSVGAQIIGAALRESGLEGEAISSLSTSIAQAIAQEVVTNAVVQVVIAGTSVGVGNGTLVRASEIVLSGLLLQSFPLQGLRGESHVTMAQALAKGISAWFRTNGVITTLDTGTPVFPFSVASGIGTGTVF